jgi:hypothetical protein
LLDASRLVHEAPKVYATFLLWLLAELFEQLPERGDADKPLLALFFDEAHLLFADTPKALQDRLEQVVRLIRSKGVGVYFVTQSPGTCRMTCWRSWPAHPARLARVHRQGAEIPAGGGRRVPAEPGVRCVVGADRTGSASAGGHACRKGHAGMVQRVLVAPPSRIGPLSEPSARH